MTNIIRNVISFCFSLFYYMIIIYCIYKGNKAYEETWCVRRPHYAGHFLFFKRCTPHGSCVSTKTRNAYTEVKFNRNEVNTLEKRVLFFRIRGERSNSDVWIKKKWEERMKRAREEKLCFFSALTEHPHPYI